MQQLRVGGPLSTASVSGASYCSAGRMSRLRGPRLRSFELRAKPCGHEHRSWHAVYDCVSRNGVPGFDLVEVPLCPIAELSA